MFKEKHKTDDFNAEQNAIKSMIDNNVDHLLVDVEWFNNTSAILNYLGIENSKELDDAALLYSKRYYTVCKSYDKLFNKYYKGN